MIKDQQLTTHTSATSPANAPKLPRIDQTIYADGGVDCSVVIAGRTVHRTRRYRREDQHGTVLGMRALRAAQAWIKANV